ncbi:MAG: LysR family transcriptional regulator [Gammaproteobacteria bacterium]
MNWDDIKLFLALVRTSSVRAAAEKTGVSHSTVARRIASLEKQLGVRLFERRQEGYVTTVAGEDMLAVAERVEHELDGLALRIVGQDRRLAGTIRITLVDFLATHWLMPHFARFSELYPNIDLELLMTYEVLDLGKREADIALRCTKSPPDYLIGKKLTALGTAAYATPAYLKRHDLGPGSTACWVGRGSDGAYPKWVKESDYPHLPARGSFDSILLQLEATKAGMGIGMLPCLLGDCESGLVRLPPGTVTLSHDLWLLTHQDVRTTARLRVCVDFLKETVEAHRDLLEGKKTGAEASFIPPSVYSEWV